MKWLTKIISSIIFFSIIATSCDITEPFSVPAWDTVVRVFLRQEEVTLKEILKNSDLDIDSTSYPQPVFSIAINDTSEKQGMDESELSFKPEDDQISENVGSIELTPEPQTTPDISLGKLIPDLANYVDQEIPFAIPDTTIMPAPVPVNFANDFEQIIIESADMFLVFHNDLIVTINPGMEISIIEIDGGREIGPFIFTDSIPSGQSLQSTSEPLNGFTLSSAYSVEYTLPVAGINAGHTLTSADTSSSFRTDVHIENVIVTEALAAVPEQTIDRKNASLLDTGENKLIEATIKSGSIQLSFNNNLSVSADLNLKILSILDQNNNTVVIDTLIRANQETIKVIDLAGKKITNHNNPGTAYLDSVNFEFTATTISTGDSLVTILSTDNIDVTVTFPDTIIVSSFSGYIEESIINIDPIEESEILNLDDFEGTIRLPDFSVELDFHNEIGFDINFDISIVGEKNGERVEVRIEDYVITGNSITTVLFNDTIRSPNIVDVMEILPSTLRVTAEGRIVGREGTVTDTDSVWIDFNIGSLMKIQITDTLTYESSVDPVDINNNTRKKLAESTDHIWVTVEPENGLPLRTQVLFIIALDSADIFNEQISDSSEKIILNTNILAGSVDANGIVYQPNTDILPALLLNDEQLQIFNKRDINGNYRPIFSTFKAFVGSRGQEVILGEKDALKLKGYFEVKYRVDLDEE